MPLYMCDGCWDEIPALKARIHCKECEDFDLCANCYVVGRFGKTHLSSHETILEERSGIEIGEEDESATADVATHSDRPLMPTSTPASAKGSSHKASSASARKKGKGKAKSTAPSPSSASALSPAQSVGSSSATAFSTPVFDTLQTYPAQPYQTYQSEAPIGWRPLFLGTRPTETMVDLLTAIFLCLDRTGSRLLSPEQYSAFLDVQGYLVEENVWKRNIQTQSGYNAEDIADFELRTAYENFSIDHVLRPRQSTMRSGLPFQAELSPISEGKMPMLSLRGFIDITTVETLGEPTAGWQRLNQAKTYYGVWMEWGDIPREIIPEFAPRELLERIAEISAFAQRQAAERMEARRRQSALRNQQSWSGQLMNPSSSGYTYQ